MADKTTTKQFQYEVQSYQEDCVNNIINLFKRLRPKESFVDVLKEHCQKNNRNFLTQDTKNIDIMIEAGVGKTFTFIKTIFELSKHLGFPKFIIFVPSVTIQERNISFKGEQL